MPMSLLAFRETVLMCADKVVSKEKVTLRYFNVMQDGVIAKQG